MGANLYEQELALITNPDSRQHLKRVFADLTADYPFGSSTAFRAWYAREVRYGHVASNLETWSEEHEISQALQSIVVTMDYLRRHHKPLPPFQEMTWAEMLNVLDTVDVRPEWKERNVLYRFEDGWTVEQVAAYEDVVLEGVLLRCCLVTGLVPEGMQALSLRNPDGFPKASVAMQDGEIVEVVGRANTVPLKPAYERRLREFFGSLGLETAESDPRLSGFKLRPAG